MACSYNILHATAVRASWLESRTFLPYVRFVGLVAQVCITLWLYSDSLSPTTFFLPIPHSSLSNCYTTKEASPPPPLTSLLTTMFKSLSRTLTTSVSRALCLPKPSPTRALSSSPSTMKSNPSSSSTSSSQLSTPSPAEKSQNTPSETYTPTDAATFSRLGASMTALPPDEVQPVPVHVQVQPPSPVTTLRCERLGGVVRSAVGEEGKEVYTDAHAAEFMRRGACMVVWPGVEGEGEEEVVEVEKGKDGERSRGRN
ncbi:hypothetical protein DL98DRAFT_524416 [Cadophora sp. DSE1049]|nr:hypothetical protein DL98DRAFT_524416 [Cadophora sp. DSE1049]